MRTLKTETCYSSLVLQRLLSEQLAGSEETDVLDHIEHCDDCRNTMSRLAGGTEIVEDIQQHLADHGVPDAGLATVLESDLVEAEIEQILAILGPTDDPHMMGRLGTYEVVSVIGRGSTGIVFKALDRGLNRFVAIKMLIPSFAGNGPARERFAREGRSIASVRDQHVVQVFAVSEHKGLPFIVMEYLPTGSLAQRIAREGTLHPVEVVRVGMQIATALAAAHRQGIVHRDVKPANVLLANGVNRALVTDFGLARLLDESSMTHSGAISGTPQFMSPEQAQGASVDHRSDLFSLGSVLYAACTGHSPFRSETVFGVIKRVCESEPRPINEVNPRVDRWLCGFIGKLHAKNPNERFQSAEEVAQLLADELAHAQSPSTVAVPPREWQSASGNSIKDRCLSKRLPIAISVVAIGVVGAIAMAMPESSPNEPVVCVVESDAEQQVDGSTNALAGVTAKGSGSTTISISSNRTKSVRIIVEDGQPCDEDSEIGAPFSVAIQLFQDKKFPEAIQYFTRAATQPELKAASLYHIACSLAKLKEDSAAINVLKQAVEAGFCNKQYILTDEYLAELRNAKPFQGVLLKLDTDSDNHLKMAEVDLWKSLQACEAAETSYREVLKQFPECELTTMRLGVALHDQGKLDEALLFHQRTAKSECYSHLGLYNIACYSALKGDKDQAFEYLKKAIEAGYTDVGHFESDEDLNSLRNDPRYQTIRTLAEQVCEDSVDCESYRI